jgi:hypothetical protein
MQYNFWYFEFHFVEAYWRIDPVDNGGLKIMPNCPFGSRENEGKLQILEKFRKAYLVEVLLKAIKISFTIQGGIIWMLVYVSSL